MKLATREELGNLKYNTNAILGVKDYDLIKLEPRKGDYECLRDDKKFDKIACDGTTVYTSTFPHGEIWDLVRERKIVSAANYNHNMPTSLYSLHSHEGEVWFSIGRDMFKLDEEGFSIKGEGEEMISYMESHNGSIIYGNKNSSKTWEWGADTKFEEFARDYALREVCSTKEGLHRAFKKYGQGESEWWTIDPQDRSVEYPSIDSMVSRNGEVYVAAEGGLYRSGKKRVDLEGNEVRDMINVQSMNGRLLDEIC